MNIEAARAILKAPSASDTDIIGAADYLIRHGQAADKSLGIMMRDAMIAPTMRVLHVMPPRQKGDRRQETNAARERGELPSGSWIGWAMPATVVFWIFAIACLVM